MFWIQLWWLFLFRVTFYHANFIERFKSWGKMKTDLKWIFRMFTWEEILKCWFSVFNYYPTHLPEDLEKIFRLRHLLPITALLIVFTFLSYSRPCISSWHSRFACKWFFRATPFHRWTMTMTVYDGILDVCSSSQCSSDINPVADGLHPE